MDKNVKEIMDRRLEKTAAALRGNNMEVYIAQDNEEIVGLVRKLLKKGSTISSGGTMTLEECGVMELMKSGDYVHLDRTKCDSREEVEDLYRRTFFADTFLTSANAVTENGELYNVDGNSNRVAAIAYGPKEVIFVIGYNKIVPTLDDAVIRVKKIAAPANGVRLGLKTPCSAKGECIVCRSGQDAASGCFSDGRMCCNYLISGYQRHKNRFKVILTPMELGY